MEKYSTVLIAYIKNMANHVSTGVFTGADFMPPDMPRDWVPLARAILTITLYCLKGKEIGVKWYILELIKYDGDVYAAVDSSLKYIRQHN